MGQTEFDFDRARGIVWVCDIADSSHYLNNRESVSNIEEFLPRFHWISRIVVKSAGGNFIKWTGDGFLAWFPTTLYRDLDVTAAIVFNAAWHLSLLVNVTQLEILDKNKFHIRHGVTFEHDALITKIIEDDKESLDLIGRSVVLAFRLSGVKAQFPSIVTQKEVIESARNYGYHNINFKHWQINSDELLKYFKSEKRGVNTIYKSYNKSSITRSAKSALRSANNAVLEVESKKSENDYRIIFASNFLQEFTTGPAWCRTVANEYIKFINEELLGSLKKIITMLKEMDKKEKEKR